MEKITLMSAHKNMFKNYANFKGRSRRKEYWLANIAFTIITSILCIIMYIPIVSYLVNGEISVFETIILVVASLATLIYSCATIVPLFALFVRRLHDIGKSGWFILFGLIPYIGTIILFVFSVIDSQPGENKYGPNPKFM